MKKICALVSMIIDVNTANTFCMQPFEEINIQPKQQQKQHTKNDFYEYSRPQEKNNKSKPRNFTSITATDETFGQVKRRKTVCK